MSPKIYNTKLTKSELKYSFEGLPGLVICVLMDKSADA